MPSSAHAAPIQAIGLVCLAGLLFVVMNALVKAMILDHHPVMLIWARYFFHVVTVVVLFPRQLGGVLRPAQLPLQFGRSVLLLVSTIANFLAFIYLPLAEVAAITFASPVLVAALAVVLLRERVEGLRWAAIIAGFMGVVLIVRPFGAVMGPGVGLALACTAAYALYQVSTRMVREAQPIVSLFFSGLVGMIVMSLIVPFFWVTPSPAELGLMALTGALGGLGHLLMIMALQRAEASRVSPFIYVQLLWAMLASIFVFGDLPDVWTLAGSSVIVLSGLGVYRLDQRQRRLAPTAGASEPPTQPRPG